MIYIYHGDDTPTSRSAFADQKTPGSITYDAENLSLVELAQTLQGSGLFGGENKIFIENLFSRKAKNVEQITELLNKSSKKSDIYLYADKPLTAKSIGEFENAKSQKFEIPKTIWNFVDGIRPSSPGNVDLFHSAINGTDVEIVFSMIIRQFRLLLGLNSNIEEVRRLQSWQTGKLSRQRSIFGEDKLRKIYQKLYMIERQNKTGGSPLTLTQSIDMLMLDL